MRVIIFSAVCGLLVLANVPSLAKSRFVTIEEKTNYYTIGGETASEFALSMGRKGPFSFQHRRRAWATAKRSMTYQLTRQKNKRSCRVTKAKVKLTITYTMPKLSRSKSISKRDWAKWNRMYKLLNKHERTHGLYYKQLAYKLYDSLLKLKSRPNCNALDSDAKTLVKKLSAEDKARNDKFDHQDSKNYRLMERIFRGS